MDSRGTVDTNLNNINSLDDLKQVMKFIMSRAIMDALELTKVPEGQKLISKKQSEENKRFENTRRYRKPAYKPTTANTEGDFIEVHVKEVASETLEKGSNGNLRIKSNSYNKQNDLSTGAKSDQDQDQMLRRHKRSSGSKAGENSTNSVNITDFNLETLLNMSNCFFLSRDSIKKLVSSMTAVAASYLTSITGPSKLPTAYAVQDWAKFLEMMCITFFAVEFIVRLIFAPYKISHLTSIFTIIDFLALVTMLTVLLIDELNPKEKYTTSYVDAINCFQVVRVFRFFRLMKDVVGFRVLIFSIRTSWKELMLLGLYIIMAVTIFSTLIYYLEQDNMHSIPDAAWWAIVTMTTVGYGDMTPNTLCGKLVGVMCALSGVLLIAVTVPVFVNNFLLFYEHSKLSSTIVNNLQQDGTKKIPVTEKSDIASAEGRKTIRTTTFIGQRPGNLKSLSADSITEISASGYSHNETANGSRQMSRESSFVDLPKSIKPRHKSETSMSKVTPILLSSMDNEKA